VEADAAEVDGGAAEGEDGYNAELLAWSRLQGWNWEEEDVEIEDNILEIC
jgi:hypothetical protein